MIRFVLVMAWRETRAARRRLLLFASAISVGVAALVAISSFTANLETTVRREACGSNGAPPSSAATASRASAASTVTDASRWAGRPA